MLFNGFKPLFQALSPADINQLSYEIVQVFQGEGGTLESLLSHTASVTSTLAGRDQVIGELIDNLNEVLDHVGDRDEQLSQLITTFRTFVGGLKDDREAILGSLDDISDLSGADRRPGRPGIREPFVGDIKQLRRARRQPRQRQGRARPRPCRCCRSSSTRSAAPRRTARGSTSTSATSRAGSRLPGGQSVPVGLQHRQRQV